jgi:hypothetical protein
MRVNMDVLANKTMFSLNVQISATLPSKYGNTPTDINGSSCFSLHN